MPHHIIARAVEARTAEERKLFISDGGSQVKAELNWGFCVAVIPVEWRELVVSTASMFSPEFRLPVPAALDRQHPRDCFDVLKMCESGGPSEAAIECMVTYLTGHDRPTHEVLFAGPKDIAKECDATFVGMSAELVVLDMLLASRERLFTDVRSRLIERKRRFLVELARAASD